MRKGEDQEKWWQSLLSRSDPEAQVLLRPCQVVVCSPGNGQGSIVVVSCRGSGCSPGPGDKVGRRFDGDDDIVGREVLIEGEGEKLLSSFSDKSGGELCSGGVFDEVGKAVVVVIAVRVSGESGGIARSGRAAWKCAGPPIEWIEEVG